MEEQRHPDAVDEVADVLRGGAPHVIVRQAAQPGRDPGQRLDNLERVSERACDEAGLRSRDVNGARLLTLSSDGDLLYLRRGRQWPGEEGQ